jgi:hypothetical protein
MDERTQAELDATDKLGIQMNRQNTDLHRLKRQQQLVKSQNFKNDAKRVLEARKEENLKRTEDLKRQLAEAAEERKKIAEDAKKRPQRMYGRSQVPLRPHDYAPPSAQPDMSRNADAEQNGYQAMGLSSAYNPNMLLDATQLTQSANSAPGRDESLGMFVPPADYLPGPLSQFHDDHSLESYNFSSLYRSW